ncbi:unnamed protein product [Didymodactylos carnosus]|uniref:DUF3830 family protein n=1 Tax=Didymodactylos carnosus TaxID=1234261 RepID=A0A815CSG3_9BILA|nr:unnamed protein product [Didymodactylos carnosus]CAF4098193.1 unnamed protein product [Didymodactylos carnosus]
MNSIVLNVSVDQKIRFELYENSAPITCNTFCSKLPFEIKLLHAKLAGEEIWSPNGPELDIIQENSTIHVEPGEIVIAPINPIRNQIRKCIGIFYGNGKLVDCANVFAKVFPDDINKLKQLGEDIWLNGSKIIRFEMLQKET